MAGQSLPFTEVRLVVTCYGGAGELIQYSTEIWRRRSEKASMRTSCLENGKTANTWLLHLEACVCWSLIYAWVCLCVCFNLKLLNQNELKLFFKFPLAGQRVCLFSPLCQVFEEVAEYQDSWYEVQILLYKDSESLIYSLPRLFRAISSKIVSFWWMLRFSILLILLCVFPCTVLTMNYCRNWKMRIIIYVRALPCLHLCR